MSSGPFVAPGEVRAVLPMGGSVQGGFDPGFRKALEKLPGWRSMGIALVDLSTGTPRYATTSQEHVDKHVYSLAKLAPLVAAFRLRERLRNQFAADPAKTADELVAKIEKAWKPLVAAQTAGRPGRPDFPNLRRIFDLSGPPWRFNFKGDVGTGADTPRADREKRDKLVHAFLDGVIDDHSYHIPKQEMATLVFMHRLRLMIRWSDNTAAGSVTSEVGLSYLFGVLTSEGLYDRGAGNGLWLSNTYGFDSKFMGFEGSGVQLTAGATAYSVAEYFTRLHRGSLVNKEASDQMLGLLATRGAFGINSYFPRHPKRKFTHSKVGYFNKTANTSEGATVESQGETGSGTSRTVKYIAVGLQDVGGGRLPDLIDIMDAYVKRANGLK